MNKYLEKAIFLIFFGMLSLGLSFSLTETLAIVNKPKYDNISRALEINFFYYLFLFIALALIIIGIANIAKYMYDERKIRKLYKDVDFNENEIDEENHLF